MFSEQDSNEWGILPPELKAHIASYLDTKSLCFFDICYLFY